MLDTFYKSKRVDQSCESEDQSLSKDTVVILGIPINNLTMEETLDCINSMIEDFKRDGRPRHIITANVDFVVNTLAWGLRKSKHPELLDVFRHANLITADGMPLVWVSHLQVVGE